MIGSTVLFSPIVFFAITQSADAKSISEYLWIRIATASLMVGIVCMIFSLGLGCDKHGGALSKLASRVLKCHVRPLNSITLK